MGGRRRAPDPAPAPYVPPPPPPVEQIVTNRAVDSGNRLVFDAPASGPRGGDAMSGDTSATDIKSSEMAPINSMDSNMMSQSGPQAMGMAKMRPYASKPKAAAAAAAAMANRGTSGSNSFQAPSVSGLRFGGS